MAFNSKLDITLFSKTIGDGLNVSVCSYNGGERKLQIGPRIYEKKNGDIGFRKAGRITADEVCELMDLRDDIVNAMAMDS